MKGSFRILSTKELPDTLLESAAAQGVKIIVQPFIRIEPVISTTYNEADTVCVFTSAPAVYSIKENARPQQICCLSGATLEAVKAVFPSATILATGNNAAALASEIIGKRNIRAVDFFCGDQRRDELPSLLSAHGISVKEIIVYRTIAAPVTVKDTYDGILFFSPSGVNSYFAVNTLPTETICFAIGQTTAQALTVYTEKIVVNTSQPSAAQLVQTAITYLNQHNRY